MRSRPFLRLPFTSKLYSTIDAPNKGTTRNVNEPPEKCQQVSPDEVMTSASCQYVVDLIRHGAGWCMPTPHARIDELRYCPRYQPSIYPSTNTAVTLCQSGEANHSSISAKILERPPAIYAVEHSSQTPYLRTNRVLVQ